MWADLAPHLRGGGNIGDFHPLARAAGPCTTPLIDLSLPPVGVLVGSSSNSL